MLENPITNPSVFRHSCAKIRFKQLYLSNHPELLTCTYELSFPTMTITITSHNKGLLLRTPYIHVHCTEKYSTNNSCASQVFLFHVFISISYHSSHNVMFTFVINIMYLLNYNNHSNFSIPSAYKKSVKVKLSFPCPRNEEI
jgi:hypothetical protein